jgi:ABC-2 type transport system permease protein
MNNSTPNDRPPHRASYFGVLRMFAQNSLVREMTFRTNFIIECVTSLCWAAMNIGFYLIIFQHVDSIGESTGWGRYEFFVFLATTWLVNAMVQTFFMPNAQEFSELIRTGGLDFALLKPIDTQFLISFRKMNWSSLSNVLVAIVILVYAIYNLTSRPDRPWELTWVSFVLYPFFVLCGSLLLYALMTCLAATSIWLGRNQSLYDFWFYITNFSRYPMEIYNKGWGAPLFFVFTFIIPVLVVINVPARILAQPLAPRANWEWPLAVFALVATIISLAVSRWVFTKALVSYRSASS